MVSNPEFLREGAAIRDFKHPDRIVIGTEEERARDVMAELYRPLYLNRAPIMVTDRRTAELIKYAANAFLATKITFINEIADLAERVGADVQEVARGIGLDNRIGSKFLHAGPGFGGSCFPKDTVALIKTAQDHEAPLRIVETVVAVNDARKRAMARKVASALGGNLRGKTVAVLGLTFKPNTDDMREAPSIPLITALQDQGAKVRAFDPVGMEQAKLVLDGVAYCASAYECAQGAHALVIVTEWEQFRALDFAALKKAMAQPDIDRSAQYLPCAGYGAARFHLRERRPFQRAKAVARFRCLARTRHLFRMRFDTALPIDAALPQLTAALSGHNAAVLVAPPGAGKTTRVPLVLMAEPWAKTAGSSCWSRGGSPRARRPSAWPERSASRSAKRSDCACGSDRKSRARPGSRSSPKASSPG